MLKRLLNFSLLVAVVGSLAILPGCFAVNMPGPGGVMPGILANVSTVPGDLTADQLYVANPDLFEVIGMVEGESGSSNVLGLVSFGDGGYRAAIEDAKSKANADGLINCVGDVKGTSFLGIYSASKTVVRGLAIKRKK